jgi:hypothetical protein
MSRERISSVADTVQEVLADIISTVSFGITVVLHFLLFCKNKCLIIGASNRSNHKKLTKRIVIFFAFTHVISFLTLSNEGQNVCMTVVGRNYVYKENNSHIDNDNVYRLQLRIQ